MIIFDIDDVLLDWSKSFDTFLRVEKGYKGEKVQDSKKRIPDLLNISHDEANKLMIEHNESDYFEQMEIKSDSGELLKFNYLSPIIGITSCGTSEMIKISRSNNMIDTFGYKLNDIIHLNLHEDKFKVLKNLKDKYENIYYLDDNIRNIEYADSIGINSFVYITEFNKDLIKENIQYVNNMKDFLKEIK